MAIGGILEWRKFPVSCKGVAFSRIRSPSKAAQIPEEGNWCREREGEQDGMGRPGEQGQCWECTLIQVTAPNVNDKTIMPPFYKSVAILSSGLTS
jgi:hypothetical protein